MKKQGQKYIEKDADRWYERNKVKGLNPNVFTQYLVSLFSKKKLHNTKVAEFGVGRGRNVLYLSNYVDFIDGYDGSEKSIDDLKKLKDSVENIDGRRVNLGDFFEPLRSYDIIIFGFFTYMITDDEFDVLIDNTKKMLNKGGYIFIYDFLSTKCLEKIDSHNSEMKVFKRDIDFYLDKIKGAYMCDFRLWDNRKISDYNFEDGFRIDDTIDSNDYNWVFSSLFKIK